MAEANQNIVDDEVFSEGENTKKKRGNNFFTLVRKALLYLLYLVLLGVFVVAVSTITVNTLQRQYQITNASGPVIADTQLNITEDLDFFTQVGEIRGSLLDDERKTYIVEIYLGYKPGDQLTLQELTRKRVQIRERVLFYFNSSYAVDLEDTRNEIRIKNELREIINRMLNNKINEVTIYNLQVIDF